MTSIVKHFHVHICHLYVFFGEVFCSFAHFLIEFFAFLLLNLESIIYILKVNNLPNT